MRRKLASRLHRWAAKLHPDYDFRHMAPYRVVFQPDRGLVISESEGRKIWYRQSEYEDAWPW